MTILLGIDGTGPASNAIYQDEFKNTFVNRIIRDSRISPEKKIYLRGPDVFGFGLTRSIKKGRDFILQNLYERSEGEPILLVGYSRGGAGVIAIAKQLKQESIPVKAM